MRFPHEYIKGYGSYQTTFNRECLLQSHIAIYIHMFVNLDVDRMYYPCEIVTCMYRTIVRVYVYTYYLSFSLSTSLRKKILYKL